VLDREIDLNAMLGQRREKNEPAAENHLSSAGESLTRSHKADFRLRITAPISLPRTVVRISPRLHSMELVFSQRADSNRAKPANAQNHSRDARRLLDRQI
jgi:hypothetical protein